MDFDRCLAATTTRYFDACHWSSFPTPAGLPSYPLLRDQNDYPSPAPSSSDPSPLSRTHNFLDSFSNTHPFTVASFNQIDSAIGPIRSNRRHSSLRQSAHPRQWSLARDQDSSLHATGSDDSIPRPDTPPLTRYGGRCTPILPSISPSLYQPHTPVSIPSPFSPYDPSRRSRARSNSNSDRRTHSPSLGSKSSQSSPPSPRPARPTDPLESHQPTSPVRPKKRERHHKHKLSDKDRKGICQYHMQHPNARQEDIGAIFNVERSTISKILKDKDRWLKVSDEEHENDLTAKHRPSKFPEIEHEMIKSLQIWADRGENISDSLIRERALEVARSHGMPPEKFKGSSGWIENFKHRHDIRRGVWLKARPPRQPSGPSSLPTLAVSHLCIPSNDLNTTDNVPPPRDLLIDSTLQDASQSNMHLVAPIQHSPTVTYGVRYGSPLVQVPEETPPTFNQAEEALNVLLAYLDTCGQELCKPREREVLQHLKWAMFQHPNGIQFERPN